MTKRGVFTEEVLEWNITFPMFFVVIKNKHDFLLDDFVSIK